jgi:glycosyltransferase involved in cell wall biosynthesis
MKLIVQIPCYNEAGTLAQTVADIPRRIPGVDIVEVLIIDDGSSDGTTDIAQAAGVDHVVHNMANLGLARTFQRGINACLERGADIIVNTDGDNQYQGGSIPDLIRPILERRADVVIGDRRPHENPEFSAVKRLLQKLGSSVVKRLAGIEAADAVSGFRAYSRDAAMGINVMTTFSYTIETLIHAGRKGLTVMSVPVGTNPKTRDSRLFTSMGGFIKKQLVTMLRAFTMYQPLTAFALIGAVMLLIGSVPILRFLYFFLIGDSAGRVQSLILGSMFFVTGYTTLIIALLSDTIATNRQLLEATLERVKRMELEGRGPAAPTGETGQTGHGEPPADDAAAAGPVKVAADG